MVASRSILVMSDTHLSPREPHAAANWSAVHRFVHEMRPERVVHVGDLTLGGAGAPAEFAHARQHLDALGVPWVAVPGNHDVGDPANAPEGEVPTEARLERWSNEIGPDHWSLDIGAWRLLGLNAQLFGSGLDAEEAQWCWLSEEIAALPAARPTALISHKPIDADPLELRTAPRYRFVPAAARECLLRLLDTAQVPIVMSGHVHQARTFDVCGRCHVWVPTTWAVLPEAAQTTVGVKRCGVLSLTLGDDGAPVADFLVPPGLTQLTLEVDIPDPYDGS